MSPCESRDKAAMFPVIGCDYVLSIVSMKKVIIMSAHKENGTTYSPKIYQYNREAVQIYLETL